MCVSFRVHARPDDSPLHVRLSLTGATMVSEDQLNYFGYDSFGILGDLELGYALWPWLAVRVSANAGFFPSVGATGGLLAPLLGVALLWPTTGMKPWLQLDGGVAFTGELQRPMLRAAVGLDIPITGAVTLGPLIGYSQVFQHDRPQSSTDARFLWFGVAVGWSVGQRHETDEQRHLYEQKHVEIIVHRRREREEPPPPAGADATSELNALLDNALPTQRNELLAPVLFSLDSAELEPQGVAMLHEVAHALTIHPQLKLIEIAGYADRRGAVEHNLELSARRANAVLEWLVAHGIARERLRVAAQGASDLVEAGSSEAEHEQNRRVVFRVIETQEASP